MKTILQNSLIPNLEQSESRERNQTATMTTGWLGWTTGLAVWVSVAIAAPTAAAQSTVHLDNAIDLVAQMRVQGEAGIFFDEHGVEYNKYGSSWANSQVVLDNPAYVHAVCSNFYIRLMMASYPGWTARGAGFVSSSPTSATIHDAIEAEACLYSRVDDFSTAQPGDVLAIKYPNGGGSSGHTMILQSATPNLEYEDGTIRWSVQVIDCSSGVHTDDSRVFQGYTSSGVGSGSMYFYTLDGEITGYSWSQSQYSTIYAPQARHIAVGRLTF